MTPEELFAKELTAYDHSIGSHDSFYYNLPYVKDYDLCNWNPLRTFSGNVIKFYQYKLDKPLILFTDTVDASEDEEVSQSEYTVTEEAPEPLSEDIPEEPESRSEDVMEESSPRSEDIVEEPESPAAD